MMQACDTMPKVVTVQQSFAASCHEGLGFEGMKRAGVLKLELLEPHDGGGIKLKNKILHPGAALITGDQMQQPRFACCLVSVPGARVLGLRWGL